MRWKMSLSLPVLLTVSSLSLGLDDPSLSPYGRQNFASPESPASQPLESLPQPANQSYRPIAPMPSPFSPDNIDRPLNSSNPYDPSTPYSPLYPYGTFPQKTAP